MKNCIAFNPQLLGTCHALSKLCARRQLRGIEERCVELQLTPAEYWMKFLNLDYPDDPITWRHVRCLGIMGGYYHDATGAKLDNLYEVYKEVTPLTREEWYQQKICCLNNIFANGYPEDLGKRVFLNFQCFINDFEAAVKD